MPPRPVRSTFLAYIQATLICVLTTLLALPAREHFDHANSAMLLLLAVLLVAWRLGRGPALLSAVLAVVCFDVFFIPPYFSLAVFDPQYLVTFCVMLAVGLVTTHLTAGLRTQASLAEKRAKESEELYAVARELTGTTTLEQVNHSLQYYLQQQGMRGELHLLQADGQLAAQSLAGLHGRFLKLAIERREDIIIDRMADADAAGIYLPLNAPMCVRGVLYIQPQADQIPPLSVLTALSSLLAIAIERQHYVAVAQQSQLDISTERLRNSLLSSLSHDLRTPLTSLFGLADTLARRTDLPHDAREIAAALSDQTRRMNHLLENLLDMARLRSGKVVLKKEWQLFEDAISASLPLLRPTLGQREIQIHLPPDLPLVAFDALLIERVLFNLIENAAKYSPATTPIEIKASIVGQRAQLQVRDHGQGFPPAKLDRIFGMFVRGEEESAQPGVGLGLAIADAIMQAHGGTISANNAPDGGAIVTLALPLGNPPAIEPEETP